jgi:hypothetical protein
MSAVLGSFALQPAAGGSAVSLRGWRRHAACSFSLTMAEASTEPAVPFAQLLRRASLIIRHHRYHRQPVDDRDVVERLLAAFGSGADRHRGVLAEAVAALMHGFR